MTCPRCTGLVVENYGDPYCVNCGYRAPVDVGREKTVSTYEWMGRQLTRTDFKRKGASL